MDILQRCEDLHPSIWISNGDPVKWCLLKQMEWKTCTFFNNQFDCCKLCCTGAKKILFVMFVGKNFLCLIWKLRVEIVFVFGYFVNNCFATWNWWYQNTWQVNKGNVNIIEMHLKNVWIIKNWLILKGGKKFRPPKNHPW